MSNEPAYKADLLSVAAAASKVMSEGLELNAAQWEALARHTYEAFAKDRAEREKQYPHHAEFAEFRTWDNLGEYRLSWIAALKDLFATLDMAFDADSPSGVYMVDNWGQVEG